MAARFFIGVFEASFGPGVAMYFSYFYPRHEFGFRFGIFISAAALASSFAGALAYALVHVTGSRIAPWRLLFIVGSSESSTSAFQAFNGLKIHRGRTCSTFLTVRVLFASQFYRGRLRWKAVTDGITTATIARHIELQVPHTKRESLSAAEDVFI